MSWDDYISIGHSDHTLLEFMRINLKFDRNNVWIAAVPLKEVSISGCNQKCLVLVAFIKVRWQIVVGFVALPGERSGVDFFSCTFQQQQNCSSCVPSAAGPLRSPFGEFCCHRGAKDTEGAKWASVYGGDYRAVARVGRAASWWRESMRTTVNFGSIPEYVRAHVLIRFLTIEAPSMTIAYRVSCSMKSCKLCQKSRWSFG